MTITNFIICHNPESMNYFIQKNNGINNCFNYVIVNDIEPVQSFYKKISIDRPILIPAIFKKNIEKYKSLLSFTAWYFLSKNNIVNTDFVGIFEYDTIFKQEIPKQLKTDTIIGFCKRELPDKLFLGLVPGFSNLLSEQEKQKALQMPYWSASSNLIMPKKFLDNFVDWYMKFIPKILSIKNHPHFHERAINVFAANNNYNIAISKIAEHQNLNSHNIGLVP